jgi:hypothetical protein
MCGQLALVSEDVADPNADNDTGKEEEHRPPGEGAGTSYGRGRNQQSLRLSGSQRRCATGFPCVPILDLVGEKQQ